MWKAGQLITILGKYNSCVYRVCDYDKNKASFTPEDWVIKEKLARTVFKNKVDKLPKGHCLLMIKYYYREEGYNP